MKNLLYREQLKAIQDDMLPFGIISDGSDHHVQGVGMEKVMFGLKPNMIEIRLIDA